MSGNSKKKKRTQNNPTRRDYVESLKQKEFAKKAVAQENKEAEANNATEKAMEGMSEEDKKLFMSQEEVLRREEAVAARESALSTRETTVTEKEGNLTEKETTLNQQEETLKAQKTENEKEDKRLKQWESKLSSQERSLIERENNALAGFTEQNRKALEILRSSKASLEGEIVSLEKKKAEAEKNIEDEMQKIRDAKLSTLNTEMDGYRKQRRAAVESEVKELKQNAQDTITAEKNALKEQRDALNTERKEISELKIKLDKKASKLEEDESNLAVRENILQEDIDDNEQKINAEVEKRTKKTEYDLRQTRADLERTNSILLSTQQELSFYKEKEREANGQTQEELLGERDQYKNQVRELREELAQRPTSAMFAEYQAKAENYDSMSKELHDTHAELEQLKLEENKWMDINMQLARARSECMAYEKMVEAKQAILDKYSEEVNRLRSLYEQPKELAAREETIKMPVFARRDFADVTADQTEREWLNTISRKCEESGIRFGKRLLYAFHTALKTAGWSPLTVLAGVSGTGKSLLPEYYSRYGGIYFMSMAVQPDWDSPQSLFGYFNSVDNRFNATPLLQAMVQFRADQAELETNLSDSMIIVLLDEMNLAHVELYFSDMLSKLERCRNTDEPVCVDIDLGAGMKKYQLPLGDNVLWVGTMNEDETTKSLSDKVLDRGNLISFPRPRTFESRHFTKGVEASQMLRKDKWESWMESNVIENPLFVENIAKYKKGLEEINEALVFAGRALGHRVWQSVENYISNHPLVIEACCKEKASSEEVNRYMRYAFEEALVYKVMPKLRGIETDGDMRARTLNKISEILFAPNTGLAPGLESDYKKAITNPYETFIWNSADYLEEEGLFE